MIGRLRMSSPIAVAKSKTGSLILTEFIKKSTVDERFKRLETVKTGRANERSLLFAIKRKRARNERSLLTPSPLRRKSVFIRLFGTRNQRDYEPKESADEGDPQKDGSAT